MAYMYITTMTFIELKGDDFYNLGYRCDTSNHLGYKTKDAYRFFNIAFVKDENGVWSFFNYDKNKSFRSEYLFQINNLYRNFYIEKAKIERNDIIKAMAKILPNDLVGVISQYVAPLTIIEPEIINNLKNIYYDSNITAPFIFPLDGYVRQVLWRNYF